MLIQFIFFTVSLFLTFLFFVYGFNLYYLLSTSRKYRVPPLPPDIPEYRPRVAIHLPIYNEKYVIGRLVDACIRMAETYDRNKVYITIIDDSDDDTLQVVDRIVQDYSKKDFQIEALRRTKRQGFKAGALQLALERSEADYIAVFDADFIPPADFLTRTIPYFSQDDKVGIIQGRWGHINRDYNFLTRAIAIGIDVHFLIEQAGRYATGSFQNFNGSGGVLRRKAMLEAGGWQADTLAEDLDISYRIQLHGYRILFLSNVESPGEIPPTVPSFKKQQGRWANGSLRTARKILPSLLVNRDFSINQRLEAFIHLTGYLIHPLMFFSFLLACLSTIFHVASFRILRVDIQMIISGNPEAVKAGFGYALHNLTWILLTLMILLCTVAAWISPMIVLKTQKLPIWRNMGNLIILFLLGCGVSLSNTIEAGKALLSNQSWAFRRTPKYALQHDKERWQTKKYQVPLDFMWALELILVSLGIFSIADAIWRVNYDMLVILIPYTIAYAFVVVLTAWQSQSGARA